MNVKMYLDVQWARDGMANQQVAQRLAPAAAPLQDHAEPAPEKDQAYDL